MTFLQWAGQYFETADILRERIKKLKEERRTAALFEIPELNFRIKTMRSMYTDCVKTGNELKKRKGEV